MSKSTRIRRLAHVVRMREEEIYRPTHFSMTTRGKHRAGQYEDGC